MSDETERQKWDMGDPEPENVTALVDCTAPADPYDSDSDRWHRTYSGWWQSYKNGGEVALGGMT